MELLSASTAAATAVAEAGKYTEAMVARLSFESGGDIKFEYMTEQGVRPQPKDACATTPDGRLRQAAPASRGGYPMQFCGWARDDDDLLAIRSGGHPNQARPSPGCCDSTPTMSGPHAHNEQWARNWRARSGVKNADLQARVFTGGSRRRACGRENQGCSSRS